MYALLRPSSAGVSAMILLARELLQPKYSSLTAPVLFIQPLLMHQEQTSSGSGRGS